MEQRPTKTGLTGRNIVVIGAGSGLGRYYALELARNGASVLLAGRGENVHAVSEEIHESGGTAECCVTDALDGKRIVQTAIDSFGSIDAMIHNAGITKDRSFKNMTEDDWQAVMRLHVDSAFACAKAAWMPMCEQKSGHLLFTTSGAGMHGNYGQANYAAAKGAILGFMKTLALEGRKYNIKANALAPMAVTRMTRDIFDAEQKVRLHPELVAPVAAALVHPLCTTTGAIIECGGGWAGALRWQRSSGVREATTWSTDPVAFLDRVTDFEAEVDYPSTTLDSLNAATGKSQR